MLSHTHNLCNCKRGPWWKLKNSLPENMKSSTLPFCKLVIYKRYSSHLGVDLPHLLSIIQKWMHLRIVWGTSLQTFGVLIFPSWIFQITKNISPRNAISPHCNKHREPMYSLTSISKARELQERRHDQRQSAKQSVNIRPIIHSSSKY